MAGCQRLQISAQRAIGAAGHVRATARHFERAPESNRPYCYSRRSNQPFVRRAVMSRRVSSFSGAFWFTLFVACGFVAFVAVPRQLLAADLVIEHVSVVSPERSSALPDAIVR